MSPTQRSLTLLRERGWKPAIVEHYNSHMGRRVDLWGIIDILALRGDEILAVQTTSTPNISARIKKIEESEWLPIIREAGVRIEVHGWRRYKKQQDGKWWRCKVVDVS